MQRRERVTMVVALVLAGVLAAVVVVGVVQALGTGTWVLASSAAVLMAAAVSQWAAVRARARGDRLLAGELALLLVLAALGLVLCAFDFVTGTRDNRAFTVLFAAGLIAVVGTVIGSHRRRRPNDDAGATGS